MGGGGEMFGGAPSDHLIRSLTEQPSEIDKPMIIELAIAAMDEFLRMAQVNEPLWLTTSDNGTTTNNVLNEDEYNKMFQYRCTGPTPAGYITEASRDSAVVIINHVNLVQILMDAVTSQMKVPKQFMLFNIYIY